MVRRSLSVLISLGILAGAPGTGFYDAAAQVVRGPAGDLVGGVNVGQNAGLGAAGLQGSLSAPGLINPGTPLLSPAAALNASPAVEGPGELERLPVKIELPSEVTEKMTPAQKEDSAGLIAMLGKRLFTWSKVAIKLPGTIFDGRTGPVVDMGQLFQAPTGDEVARLAMPPYKGAPRPTFDDKQLPDIEENGGFSVESKDLPGQNHVWKTGGLLQKGRVANKETLRQHLATGVGELIVKIPNRISGDKPLSALEGVRNTWNGLRQTVGLVFGAKETRSAYDSYGIANEVEKIKKDRIVHFFGSNVFYDDKLMQEAYSIVEKLGQQAEAAWQKKAEVVRGETLAALRKEGVSEADLPQALADRLAQAAQDEFYGVVLKSEAVEALHKGLGPILVNHGKAEQIIRADEDHYAVDYQKRLADETVRIRAENPVRSKLAVWLNAEVSRALAAYYTPERVWGRYGETAEKLDQASLSQEADILRKEALFYRDIAPGVRARLQAARAPAKTFSYEYGIWRKSHWKILKHEAPGDREYFYAQKSETSVVATDSFAWRLQNWWHRSASWFKNGIYGLIVSNLINGPLGFRSLGGNQPFHYKWNVDPKTGALVESSSTHETWASRIRGFWASRREILQDHERKNSYGIFGKGVERIGLFFTADLLRGLIAPILVGVLQPVFTLLINAPVSLVFAATAFLWAPALSTAVLAAQALLMDTAGTQYPRRSPYRFVPAFWTAGRVLIGGAAQGIASVFTAVFFHFPVALAEFATGGIRWGGRAAYDKALFQLIKKYGKIPGRDSRFIVKRVAGPGLSSEFFFQVAPDLATVALWASIEQDELARYSEETSQLIGQPGAALREFIEVFSALTGSQSSPTKNAPAYSEISAKQEAALKELREAAAPRQALYGHLLQVPHKGQIKLTAASLEETLRLGAVLSQKFYSELFQGQKWPDEKVKGFWAKRGLDSDDWVGLVKSHLADVFGPEFLVPLEQTDTTLRIAVKSSTLGDFARGLESGVLPEDLKNVRIEGLGNAEQKPVIAAAPRVGSREIVDADLIRDPEGLGLNR